MEVRKMAFKKYGSPQPLEVIETCQKCGQNKAEHNVNGTLVCTMCKETKKESEDESSSEENL